MDFFEDELKNLKQRVKWDFKDLEEGHVTSPLMNLKENSEIITVKIVLPDVARKDISLKISTNSIEIRAKKKIAVEVKKKGYHKVDTESLNYYRELDLPSPVNHKKAKVEFSNGLLKITLPKIQRKIRLRLGK
jgi:HSP20 family protein